MKAQGKALYNLLKLHALHDPDLKVQPWQIEDLRGLPLKEIFHRLEKKAVSLDGKRFAQFAEPFDTPEDLAEFLVPDESGPDLADQAYLLLFELWRRLLPDRQSLSLFCDELDHRIELYLQDSDPHEELIEEILARLEQLLETYVDKGEDPKVIFASLSNYLAHDLESFIYLFISHLIDGEDDLYASELLEGFYPYLEDPLWFDLLRVRLLLISNREEGLYVLQRFIEAVEEETDIDLSLSVLHLIVKEEDRSLFIKIMKKTLPLPETAGDLQELLEIARDHFAYFGNLPKKKAIDQLLSKCQKMGFHSKNLIVPALGKLLNS